MATDRTSESDRDYEGGSGVKAVGGRDSDQALVAVEAPPRDYRFWLVFLSIAIATVLSALELSAVSTALPRIVNDLGGTTFVWVGSAYSLAASAFIPMTGGLAQIFGRRIVMLGSLLITAVGSAICGAAPSMNVLIAGRAIQGLGGGGVASTTVIIVSDLVPLHERGAFNGLVGIAWSIASAFGPIIGGALAGAGSKGWRWLFYLNIPVCGVSGFLVFFFLKLQTPPGTLREKLSRMDWIGNFLVIAATTSCVIALSWSGIQFPWNSAQVLAPLILGLLGLVGFIGYEALVPKHPIAPYYLLSTLTGLSGYLQAFICPILIIGTVYYIPVYLQACKGSSAVGSGVGLLGVACTMAPMGIVSGLSVNKTLKYRPQLWISWALVMIGVGLLITLNVDTPEGHLIGFEILFSAGLGALTTTTYFPVLAPLPVTANAPALAFYTFLRNFAQVWGVTIGGAVLQNELLHRLPLEFTSTFPEGTAIAYSIIPTINTLQDPLRTQVRLAFAGALKVVWKVFLGIGALGLLSSLGMKHMKLHTSVDKDWGLQKEGPRTGRIEATMEEGIPLDDRNDDQHGIAVGYESGRTSALPETREV